MPPYHIPESHNPGDSPALLPSPSPCSYQIPWEKVTETGYAQDSRPPRLGLEAYTPVLPTGARQSWAWRHKQMTYPLSFSEWRLGIKKQSKGDKRQASSHGTQAHSPHSFPCPIPMNPPPQNQALTDLPLVYPSLSQAQISSNAQLAGMWPETRRKPPQAGTYTCVCACTHMHMHTPSPLTHAHMCTYT